MQHNYQEAGWWVHYPEYFVSLMKAWYGDAATVENDYAFNYLPKVVEDHSDLAMFVTMKDGKPNLERRTRCASIWHWLRLHLLAGNDAFF